MRKPSAEKDTQTMKHAETTETATAVAAQGAHVAPEKTAASQKKGAPKAKKTANAGGQLALCGKPIYCAVSTAVCCSPECRGVRLSESDTIPSSDAARFENFLRQNRAAHPF